MREGSSISLVLTKHHSSDTLPVYKLLKTSPPSLRVDVMNQVVAGDVGFFPMVVAV